MKISLKININLCLWLLFVLFASCEGFYSISVREDTGDNSGFDDNTDSIVEYESFEKDSFDFQEQFEDEILDIQLENSSDIFDIISEPDSSDPCSGIVCWEHSHCVSGRCYCDDGYVDVGGACRLPDPTDPEARTEEQVCDRWRSDYPELATWIWHEGASECDPGEVSEEARNDGVRRINLFRWLVGLEPVTRGAPEIESSEQSCAIMMLRNGTINHNPPSSWNCYTSEGARGASSSNLAMGTPTPANAIDLYISDWRNETTMGHRRWILYPPYSSAAIGHAGSFNCLHVFSWGGTSSRRWVAFPSPGPYPVQGVLGSWTFSSDGVGSSTSVSIIKESNGATIPVQTTLLAGGYGLPTVSFDPHEAVVGETYAVTVTGLSGGDVTYRIKIVDCGI